MFDFRRLRPLRPCPWPGLLLLAGFLWGPEAGAQPPPPSRETLQEVAAAHYEQEALDRGRTYRRWGYGLFFLRTALVLTVAWWLACGPLGAMSEAALRLAGDRVWLARGLILTAVFWALSILRFPFLAFGFLHARAYGLRHDAFSSFLFDLGKGLAVNWILTLVVGLIVLGMFSRWPRAWWGMAWITVAVLAAGYVTAAPLVIDPLFNRFTRLEDRNLESRLLEVASRGGVPAQEVLVADASRRTTAANAYFTGLGKTRRIVLYDTLVDNFPAPEVALIVAHEVGHWRHRHVVKGIALGLGATLLGLLLAHFVLGRWVTEGWGGIEGRRDPALAVPAYALTVSLFVVALVPSNWVSRRMETEADRASLELTGDPTTFVQAEVRLGTRNLADVVPPAWIESTLYTHPANARRIWMAETWR